MMSWSHLISAVCILLDVSVAIDDCIYKECYCNLDMISCENLQLTEIPRANVTPITGYTSLGLDSNQITVIPGGILPTNLTEIDLTNNPITIIDDTAFDASAYTLQTLDFSNALFTRIPDAFIHLKVLKQLTINNMIILDWNEEAMKSIGKSVTGLDLQNVNMTIWPTCFQYFSRLSDLTVSKGFISSLPDNALDSVSNSLLSLDLSNNSLTTVPKALSKLRVLQMLNLQYNNIKDVAWLGQIGRLLILWLNNNQISNATLLSNALRPFAEYLTDLTTQYNMLTTIPEFDYFTKLGGFDFSHNKISDPFSGSAPRNCYVIDFSYNSLSALPRLLSTLPFINYLVAPWNAIREIHGSDFPPTTTGVELGFNLISELTDTSFPLSSKIVTLHLNNNPLVSISNLAFKNVPGLVELNLANTKLTRLPLALGYLTGLTRFDITGSSGLVCTCMEKSLDKWVLSKSADSILGNCGQMNIYDFFSNLSPDCPVQ